MKDLVIFRQMLHHISNTNTARLEQFAASSYQIGNVIEQVIGTVYVCLSDQPVDAHVCENEKKLLAWVANHPKSTVYRIINKNTKIWDCIYSE